MIDLPSVGIWVSFKNTVSSVLLQALDNGIKYKLQDKNPYTNYFRLNKIIFSGA